MSNCKHGFMQVGALTWKCAYCNMEADATYMALHFSAENAELKREVASLREREIDLVNTLENGISGICNSIGISTEHYDDDVADICCYAECFSDAAKLLKKSGCSFDSDENVFVPNIYGEG